jgi:plasmid stabilization system protein ParE
MRWTVVWLRDASNDLADIWTAAADRRAVTDAADRIEHLLSTQPDRVGTPLREGLMVLEVGPLRVIWTMSEADRKVEVARVLPRQQ